MRILFVTSSLEPGRDGVCDYTFELVSACRARGWSCSLLALNDRHIDQTVDAPQILRLSAADSWSERVQRAAAWVRQIDPDWVSLQFVAYGFHPKGIVGNLGRKLESLFAGQRIHLMMHEMWIGMHRAAPLSDRIIGRLQRSAVLSMIRRLDPVIVHTSNISYLALLRREGVDARLLPLWGNVPVTGDADPKWLGQQLQIAGVAQSHAIERHSCWRFGLFGSLHSIRSLDRALEYIGEAAQTAGRHAVIASIGRQGQDAAQWQDMCARHQARFSFAALGERSTAEISTFFQSVDFGIAMTPWQLIGKSGSVAAMLEHGLPVLVTRDDTHFGIDAATPLSPQLYRMDADTPRWLLNVRRQTPRSRLHEIVAQFVADIEDLGVGPQGKLPTKSCLPIFTPQ